MTFPNTFASDGSLYILKNNFATTLNGGLTVDAVVATLTSTSPLPQVGYITVETEAVKYTANNTATSVLSGLTRGADSTTAAIHADGTAVYGNYVADHHNAMKDEIILIEQNIVQKLGSGTATIAVPASVSSDFNGTVSLNTTTTINGPATFNTTTVFNGPVTINSTSTINGPMTFNTATTANAPFTFNTTTTFNTSATFSPGTTSSAALHGADADTGINFPSAGALQIVSSGTSIMEISSAGLITQSKQACFLVSMTNSTSNITGDNSSYTIPWDLEVFDIGACFSSPSFTAPITGKYQFNLTLLLTNWTASAATINVVIRSSNRDYNVETIIPGQGGSEKGISFATVADMDAGDTAFVLVQVAGTTKTIALYKMPYVTFSGSLLN